MGKKSKNDSESEKGDPGSIEMNDTNAFISQNRKCTDILCCLLFVVFWIGMIAIGIAGVHFGEPAKLIYGNDWKGRTCGAKGADFDFLDKKYLLYPRITEDIYDYQMENGMDPTSMPPLSKFFGICVSSCPDKINATTGEQMYAHAYTDVEKYPDAMNGISTGDKAIENTQAGSPWSIALNTTNVLYRCLDLTFYNQTAYVRCTDDCEVGQTSNCGQDEAKNPFRPCGQTDCYKALEKFAPKCRTADIREVVDKRGAAKSNPIYDRMNDSWQLISRWMGDVEKSFIPILVCGGLLAIVLGFVWLVLMKYCAGLFVWLTILLLMLMLAIGTLYVAYRGELFDPAMISDVLQDIPVDVDIETYISPELLKKDQDQVKYWRVAAYIFMALDALILLAFCVCCSRVKIAVGIIREASKAVQRMPMMVAFPLLPAALIFVLLMYFLVMSAYIATSGKVTFGTVKNAYNSTVDTDSFDFGKYEEKEVMNYMLAYHVFGFLWTNQFLQALGYMTIAGAVAEYYWTLDKTSIRRMPIFRSFHRVIRYHLGSIAFGSLIIAIVQMMRLVLEYIDQKTKQAQEGNKVMKVAMLCCKCFLWCFEQCLKFINKNTYIVIAMKGTSFCSAMKDAFQLILANIARVATVGIISTFLILLGKLFIVAFATLCMFIFINKPPKNIPALFLGDLDDVNSPVFPMLVTAVLSYAIASVFLGVYETAIDTILLCFCEDCKVNKQSGTYYMSDELLSYVDGAAKKNAFRHYKNNSGGGNIQDS